MAEHHPGMVASAVQLHTIATPVAVLPTYFQQIKLSVAFESVDILLVLSVYFLKAQ